MKNEKGYVVEATDLDYGVNIHVHCFPLYNKRLTGRQEPFYLEWFPVSFWALDVFILLTAFFHLPKFP